MSKKAFVSRYFLIINKLRKDRRATYQELEEHITRQLEYLRTDDPDLEIGFSKRTLQRDIREIRDLFGIDIICKTPGYEYQIEETSVENMNYQQVQESFDLMNALSISQEVSSFVFPENKLPKGTEHLYGLIHAIRNQLEITFTHRKYWEESGTDKKVAPYMMKEFKGRWYLIGYDTNVNEIRTYGLDRISELGISHRRFKKDADFSSQQYFKYSYGIIVPYDQEPEEVVLSFTNWQGNYIKSFPLHHSQEIMVDNDKELRVKFRIHITHDFVMQLFSFGNEVEVIEPKGLRNRMKSEFKKAVKRYE